MSLFIVLPKLMTEPDIFKPLGHLLYFSNDSCIRSSQTIRYIMKYSLVIRADTDFLDV
jgi:hypothetical protein